MLLPLTIIRAVLLRPLFLDLIGYGRWASVVELFCGLFVVGVSGTAIATTVMWVVHIAGFLWHAFVIVILMIVIN